MSIATSSHKVHHAFTVWARQKGIVIDNVAPARFTDSGLGIVAKRKIEAGEIIVSIPRSMLLSMNSVPIHIRNATLRCSVHGQLAAYLALEKDKESFPYRQWHDTWPSDDLMSSVPFYWADKLVSHLPLASRELLKKQRGKANGDYAIVSKAYPELSKKEYYYYWMIVNTRSFYYEDMKNRKAVDPEDCMALCPFADYFNHSDRGCRVTFGMDAYTVEADKTYEVGQELLTSYGNHSNDFLLVEYGFILSSNRWDEVRLDDMLLPQLSASEKGELDAACFLGNYTLDCQTVCYRTLVVLRWKCGCAGLKDILNGNEPSDFEKRLVDSSLSELIKAFAGHARQHLKDLREMVDGNEYALNVLQTRWNQIIHITDLAIEEYLTK